VTPHRRCPAYGGNLTGHLMAWPEFTVTGGGPLPEVEPLGLLEGLPAGVLEKAREWERHVVEVQRGLPPDPAPGVVPRRGFDPAATTLAERDRAKAAELGVSVRTVEARRARYARQGLWGLVDQRAARGITATGRADARLVAVIRDLVDAETDTSTGTRSRLIRRAVKAVEAAYGPGVVPLPGRTTFYKVIDAVAVGRHTFGSAVTRRQVANRPQGAFTPAFAARPGEQLQIDSTPIDVLVWLEDGVPARADLTIAVDVATRTICAAVLRPAGTKAVDAALLLARMLVPEPMRPGWAAALRMAASRLPHARLLGIDARMQAAAARPVIVPDTIVIDGGKVFISGTFTRACERLGISVQRARPGTPTDKPIVEATFSSIKARGVAGMADHRTGKPASPHGQVDPAVVEAMRQAITEAEQESSRTATYLFWRTGQILEAAHGPGVVELPSQRSLYRLLDKLSAGRHKSAPGTASGSATRASPTSTSPPAQRSSPPSTGPAGSCAATPPRN
jgi:putative transposase